MRKQFAAGKIKQCHGVECKLGKSNKGCKRKPGGRHGGTEQTRKKKNPVEIDGRTLLCDSYGSYRHFVAGCLDRLENMDQLKKGKKTWNIGKFL